jgi:drug/metabolite transporter (DMT)-like permease
MLNNPYIPLMFSGILYMLSASIPFLGFKSALSHYILAATIGLSTAIFWAMIVRKVEPTTLSFWGLLYDSMLTSIFFIVPQIWTGFKMGPTQYIGAILVVVGLSMVRV